MGGLKAEMLKYSILLLAIFFTYQAVAAQGNASLKEEEIVDTNYDVTGDKQDDQIIITGIKYEAGNEFLRKITLKVKVGSKLISADLGSGYHPYLQLVDFTNDGIPEIFVTVETGGSGGNINTFVYSFKNGKMINLSVPEGVPVTAQFINSYKAKICIQGQPAVLLDVSARKAEYDRLGLYKDGLLNEATELMVDPYSSLKIIDVNHQKGLEGIQRVSGAYHADSLVNIRSVWSFHKGKWQLIEGNLEPLYGNIQFKIDNLN